METKSKISKPIQPILNKMEVGDKEIFPAHQLGSVRSLCSDLGFKTDKKFRSSIDRINRVVMVTRER